LDKSSFGVDLPVFGEKKNKMAIRARKNIFFASLKQLLFSRWLVLLSAFDVETLGFVC